MIRLPEKVRKTLEKAVNEIKTKKEVYGIGLFGSWSRGDAETSSDIDLFILNKNGIEHEYVERVIVNDLFVDLNFVPKSCIMGVIPPEIDQKLYEMQILYDRDWSLTNTKLLMTKSYSSPERVDIRTEAHVIDSDIYLSRATSAFSREDFHSAQLFSKIALESMLKVIVEIALMPISNSRFLGNLEVSMEKLGVQEFFSKYLEVTKLNSVDDAVVAEKLKLFKIIWDEISFITKRNAKAFGSAYFKVRMRLKYYLNPAFLQGMFLRAEALAGSGRVAEAVHCLNGVFVDLLENYVWFRASTEKVKVDIATMLRFLKDLEKRSPKNYAKIIEFLGLSEANRQSATRTIEETKRIMLKIRGERKALIKSCLLKS